MIVVDTSAVVAIIRGEPEEQRLLAKLMEADGALMSAGSVLELQLAFAGKSENTVWPDVGNFLRIYRVSIRPFDERQLGFAREAAVRFGKGRHKAKFNYGDCFAYALARAEGVPLLCTGRDFAATDVKIA